MYDKNKGTSVDENIVSGLLEYNHDSWESEYLKQLTDFSDKVTESNAPMQNCGSKPLDFADAQTAPAPSHVEEKDNAGQTNSSSKGRATQPCTQLSSALPSASTRAGLKQLDFADAQTAPAPSHAKSNSSKEKDKAGQTNSSSKGRATLSSALSTASTRAGPKQLDFADAQTAPAPSHAKSNSSEEKDEAGQTNSCNKGRATHPCTQLSSALSTASLTRAELAALDILIPPVSPIYSLPTSLHVQIAYSHLSFIDPFSLVQRPCEAVVTAAAEKLLSEQRRKRNHPSGVVIKGFG